jgi:hypothetical protein
MTPLNGLSFIYTRAHLAALARRVCSGTNSPILYLEHHCSLIAVLFSEDRAG